MIASHTKKYINRARTRLLILIEDEYKNYLKYSKVKLNYMLPLDIQKNYEVFVSFDNPIITQDTPEFTRTQSFRVQKKIEGNVYLNQGISYFTKCLRDIGKDFIEYRKIGIGEKKLELQGRRNSICSIPMDELSQLESISQLKSSALFKKKRMSIPVFKMNDYATSQILKRAIENLKMNSEEKEEAQSKKYYNILKKIVSRLIYLNDCSSFSDNDSSSISISRTNTNPNLLKQSSSILSKRNSAEGEKSPTQKTCEIIEEECEGRNRYYEVPLHGIYNLKNTVQNPFTLNKSEMRKIQRGDHFSYDFHANNLNSLIFKTCDSYNPKDDLEIFHTPHRRDDVHFKKSIAISEDNESMEKESIISYKDEPETPSNQIDLKKLAEQGMNHRRSSAYKNDIEISKSMLSKSLISQTSVSEVSNFFEFEN